MPQPLLIVFVKAPRAGFVKSRIAKAIGEEAALEVYRLLVLSLLTNIVTVENVELRFTPDDAESEVSKWIYGPWGLSPQGNGDLGDRLVRAFAESFMRGKDRVLIVGSDCPYLTTDDLVDADELLDEHDVVLGPARDGGYWLVGLKEQHPELFAGIEWSSPKVFSQTVAIAEANGLRIGRLRTLEDIDTHDDLQRFFKRRSKRG